jgi:hypothetical protein
MSERFLYQPNKNGKFEYKVPVPCDKLSREISAKIQKSLDTRSDFRKSDKGFWRVEQYGFKATEIFFDMEACKGIKLKADANKILKNNNSIIPLNNANINEEGAYLLWSFDPFEEGLGKQAFKNRVVSLLSGSYLDKTHKERLNEAIESAKWLHSFSPLHLKRAISD